MLPTKSSLIHRKGDKAVSAEANKALVRRFVDEPQSAGNIDLIDGICSPGLVNHTPPARDTRRDCEGIEIVTAMFRRAFPGSSCFTVEGMMAEGDELATRKTFRGTHEGQFMGIPPSGRSVSMGLMDMCASARGGWWNTGRWGTPLA
jgi:SnoaL-like polyketide cyclase